MIQTQSILEVADNSGAKSLMCIKVLGGSKRRYARVGDIIVASIKNCQPHSKVKSGGGTIPVPVIRNAPLGKEDSRKR